MSQHEIECKRYPDLKVYDPEKQVFHRFVNGLFYTEDDRVAELVTRIADVTSKHVVDAPVGRFQPMVDFGNEDGGTGEDAGYKPLDVLELSVRALEEAVESVSDIRTINESILIEEAREDREPRAGALTVLRERKAALE